MIMLQWGHNFSVMEIQIGQPSPIGTNTASMGPQLFSYGNKTDIEIHLKGILDASMGPQLFSYGN